MENTPKTDNFLKAIKKYAAQQKKSIQSEVEQLKEEKIKDAETKARLDSEKLIKDELEAKRNEQTVLIAKATQNGQKELFLERSRMTDEVFSIAEEKLLAFTAGEKYKASLENSAKEIAALFGDKSCVLYVKESDLETARGFSSLFAGNAEVLADKSIKIGGIKGCCEEMSIVADDTLDSKLLNQRAWFIENANLSLL